MRLLPRGETALIPGGMKDRDDSNGVMVAEFVVNGVREALGMNATQIS